MNNKCLFYITFVLVYLLPAGTLAQTVLRYSDHESPDEMRTLFLRNILFPNIEKESEGRIKIEAHWNGELAISYDAMKKVSAGDTVDITTVVPEYNAKELPTHQLFKSFLVGPSGGSQVAFFRKVYATIPEFAAELRQNNVEPIFLSTGYGVGFFSKNKIHSLSDIKGKRWRTASFWHRDYLSSYGSIPVSIQWGEKVYEAFANNSLDGLMVNIDDGYKLKIHEQAPYILTSKHLWLGHLYIVSMNKTTWDGLEQRDKEAIRRAAEKSYKKLGEITDRSFYAQLEKLQEAGAEYRLLSDSELKDFEHSITYRKIQDKWVKEQEVKGVRNIAAILAEMRHILKK